MNRFLCNIICGFIPSKKLRHKFRRCNDKEGENTEVNIIKSNNNFLQVVEENLVSKNKKSTNNKILLIYPNNFLKNNAGNNSYVFNIIKLLNSIGFKIDFLSSDRFNKNDFNNFEELNKKYKFIDNLYLGKFEANNQNIYAKSSWVDDNLLSLFQKIINKNQYSYILSNYIEFSDLFRLSNVDKNTRIINVMHDCRTMQNFFGCNNNYDNIGYDFEEEIKLLQYYDDILCISNDEKYIFEKFYKNKNFYWLPHFGEFKKTENTKKDIDCLFIGYSNPYNLNAIIWFFEKVYPLFNKKVNLTICGKVGNMIKEENSDIYKKMVENNVNFIDFAEDLDNLYSRTKIAIVPMFDGTGLKVKTITAMSYGIPVVGTRAAIDGFADKNENPCLITDDEKEFAHYIKKLLNNKEFYDTTSQNIENYFNKYFSIKNSELILKKVFGV